jgi:hypothetical protein
VSITTRSSTIGASAGRKEEELPIIWAK